MSKSPIVLTGVTGCRNRGVEALVVSACVGLRKYLPDAEISVLTSDQKYDQNQLAGRATPIPNSLHFPYRNRLKRAAKAIQRVVRGRTVKTAAQAIDEAVCVIASGGDIFSSDYGEFDSWLHPLERALDAGKPVVFLAHSIGPFKSQAQADAFAAVARRASLVTLREGLSQTYAVEKLGLNPKRLVKTADVAFLLPIPDAATLVPMQRHYGLHQGVPVVAVAPSQGIKRYAGLDEQGHVASLASLVRLLRTEMGARVVLVPHVQERSLANDDRVVCTKILSELGWDPGVTLVGAHHSASEFKGIVSGCDLVIAERMHAAIAGLGTGVPTLAIGYSVKARGILQEFFGEQSGEYLLPVENLGDVAASSAQVRTMWANRSVIAATLKRVLPAVKGEADRNFSLLAALLAPNRG